MRGVRHIRRIDCRTSTRFGTKIGWGRGSSTTSDRLRHAANEFARSDESRRILWRHEFFHPALRLREAVSDLVPRRFLAHPDMRQRPARGVAVEQAEPEADDIGLRVAAAP